MIPALESIVTQINPRALLVASGVLLNGLALYKTADYTYSGEPGKAVIASICSIAIAYAAGYHLGKISDEGFIIYSEIQNSSLRPADFC